jgi:excisionase family DNA binding protein
MRRNQRAIRLRPHPRRVKQSVTYDVSEAARLLGVHRNTIRRWLKDGLEPIDARRPLLIHGAHLKAFLARRKQCRKQACRPGEFFCFRCRVPRKPWGGTADVTLRTHKLASLLALCAECETPMYRAVRVADLPSLRSLLDLKTLEPERMNDRPIPT